MSYLRRCFLALACLFWAVGADAAAITIASPDGQVRFQLSQDAAGRLSYSVSRKEQPVIGRSRLSIIIDGVDLSEGAKLGKSEEYQVNEKYAWRGVHSEAVNRCNGAKIPAAHPKGEHVIEVRAFDDGVAFRHIIPGKEGSRVPDEGTTFVLPAGSTVWFHDLGGHYEDVHEKRDIAQITDGQWAAPPVTFRLPGDGGYASITEAALINYSGMALQADGRSGFAVSLGHEHPISYPFRLRYSNDIDRVSRPAAIAGTITTPWRVVMIAPD
jgi:alpha-glucosidase